MLGHITISFLALQMLVAATPTTQGGNDGVQITNLDKNATSTSGTGSVAAAGNLAPFGTIGVGCGINWESDVSYGGGLQAGSDVSDFGLGGGFTINPNNITIGLGVGLNAANASASVSFTGDKDGNVEFTFVSSSFVACTPGMKDGKSTVSCKTAKPLA
ncbi:hypothetical protein Ptr902_02331 [Pyrenophora tritici-repentis]|nr:hypothetical protein Ptr902_02331 [Pyrenophora tritici-repentis]